MFGSVGRAFGWWIDGLVDALAALTSRFGGGKRLRVVPSGQGMAVERPGRRGRTEMRIAAGGQGAVVEPAAARRAIAGQRLDVLIDPETALVRVLDPLPPESEQYLDGIIRHQVERLTPWLASDVLYGYRAAPASAADPRLVVTVVATARSFHAALLSALRAAGARDIRLLYEDGDIGSVAVPVDAGLGEAARRAKSRRLVTAAVGLTGLAAAAGCAFLWLGLDSVRSEIAGVEQSIEARRRILLAATQKQDPAEQREFGAMLARKREAPVAVLALEALSSALPDDTFVSELRFGEGRVRIIGTSRSVAGLVPLVEERPEFGEAGFFAPTTRLPDGRGDRFHIDARWLASEAPK